jgi:hypothetical protein
MVVGEGACVFGVVARDGGGFSRGHSAEFLDDLSLDGFDDGLSFGFGDEQKGGEPAACEFGRCGA